MSTTLRVDESTRDRVNRLGAQTDQSADGVLTKALDAYEDALYWQEWRAAREAESPAQKAAYAAEARAWDRVSSVEADAPR